MDSPIATALLNELASLDVELVSSPGNVYASIHTLPTSTVKSVKQAMGNRNNAAARVVGRISLFLEDLLPNSEIIALEKQHERLRGEGFRIGTPNR